ncbi:pirin family protein [Fulvivirgaceae bacterium BMA10]|uniref:Pirin family protein n=1 Tax=Splendidivirga corallicola TaxID=3051826 RepID=A0ABT8KVA6_9BACT|nr:pirin family protein [Fulvivirgaceae bacterium BMA10]
MKRKLKRLQPPRNGIQYIVHPETREELSPFVFFDARTMHRHDEGLHIGMHPHSGIGILTYFNGGELLHEDTGGNNDTIREGGIQWIRAGGGVWHEEHYQKKPSVQSDSWPLTIHQLWLQLPPELEESSVEYQNIRPENLPIIDNVKVIAGTYKKIKSPLKVPFEMTYLDVVLEAGEHFTFSSPASQKTGFIFPRIGDIHLHGEKIPLGNLGILESNDGELLIEANSHSRFVLITTLPQKLPKVVQGGSMHTSKEAMKRSLDRIQKLQFGSKIF